MKFESKFGTGEICAYGEDLVRKGGRDHLVKIVAVLFGLEGEINYWVEVSTSRGIQRIQVSQSQLTGDTRVDDMIDQHIAKLGFKCRDKVSGLEGVITAITFDLYGCIQAIVHPGITVEGNLREIKW